MLTLLKNIERFNKRYNKKRGSAMLMVLMTMAIIIVVGTSMLFVTLSSFSNSIADTQQERAYNAALTVSDTLKGSTQLNTIIETYFTKIKENGSAEVQFYNDTDFDNQAVNYTIVNGVKVYVTLSKSPSSSANKIDKVLVDIKGVKGSQESTVSFEADSVPDGTSTTIQDTFGNSFVVSNNMGSSVTSPYQIYKRIEGDVSINCFDTENGERVMKTRIFNPVVLEGVTGSVYANGDLIIGAPDNMLRVQGNVYVDGNLTIRGLALGVNLPALTKKYYAKKYLYYYTYAYGEFGSIAVPPNNKAGYKNSSTTKLGEAMYEKLSDGTYRPIQTYDKLSHFTLMDLAGDANEYTFWTKNYGENNTTGNYTWEQVTITLRVKDKNGIWQNIDAEYNQGGINNAQYLGASMYSDTEGDGTPIMQYPQGGNIYCSGDIIFDTVNVGNVFSFDAGVFNTGSTDAGHEDQDEKPDPSALDKINKWLSEHLGIDLVNPRFPYYSYAYNLDGTIPVHTKIEGDVFCQGRLIIAPETQKSYINYKDEQWLGIASDLSNKEKYINGTVVASDDFVLKDSGAFLSQIKNKWKEILGEDKFNYNNGTLSENPNAMKSFIEAYKEAYKKLKTEGKTIERLKEKFEELGKDGYYYLTGGNYTQFGNGNGLNGADIKEKNKTIWYDFRKPEFSETSNLYIQNSPIRKGTSCGDIDHKNSNGVDPCTLEKYASDDKYRVVENVDEKDKDGKPVTTRTKVGGISYTAALSVRYCEITVNNVYCDGTISVLSSDLGDVKEKEKVHFVNSAAVNVKNNYFGSDFVKNELKKASIMDFLKYVLQKNNAQLTDEEILKEYFGIDGNKNNFKAETKLYFDMQNKYNNSETSKEWWAGLWNTGGSELAGLEKLSYVLSGNDILGSEFLNTKYLIAMFSNGANDFDGIDLNALLGAAANGLVGSAIIGGKLKTFGKGSTSNQFDAMKGTTKAFNEGLYGMYLAVDNRYSLVDNTATVKAIFEEIKSPEFATVVEANADQKQAKENVKKILTDLKEKGDIEEYNTFDIYGSINEYDRYLLGITSGKPVKDYKCSKGTLTKMYIRLLQSSMPNNPVPESWFITDSLPNHEDSRFNIRRYYYMESSNDIEDGTGLTLRLMDFYNKDNANSPHLRADNTFAIDEKYNQTFTGLKDKTLSGFSVIAQRSEVQYTIKQNTYFNFEASNTQVVFGASTDGVDKRVRMNFLIDTSEKDIYMFFHCKALDKSKDKKEQTRFLFQKCSFQVTGKNNAYLMLVDDTSFAANAYSLEISNTMLSEDKTDEKVGTHFKSNTYQKYVARFKGHGNAYSAWNVSNLFDISQMQALPDGDPAKVGNMFIIGMGRNYVKFGRGGSVNAMVYIPNGMYSNESSGLFNSIPIGNSGNNEASIVAKDIYIGGSSRGQLIFSSYDAAKIGSKNNNSSGLVMDGLINPDTVSHDTKWVAGDYYYG